MDLYVFTFHNDGRVYRALSVLSPEEVHAHGLPTEAVLGEISALLPSMTPDQFEHNDAFVTLLHNIVQKHAPDLPDLQLQANTRGTGVLAIIDQRAGQVTGDIDAQDIIGRFDIRRGNIVADSYQPNELYRLLTDNGPIQLSSQLETKLLSHINNLIATNTGGTDG